MRWSTGCARAAIATCVPLRGPTRPRRHGRRLAQPGDFVVCLGAGNITTWAYALPSELAERGAHDGGDAAERERPHRAPAPAARPRCGATRRWRRFTWFRVGGPAEVLFRPADADDLARVPARAARRRAGHRASASARTCSSATAASPASSSASAGGFARVAVEDDGIVAGAAALDLTVAEHAAQAPASPGSSSCPAFPARSAARLRMNAGAYGGESQDLLVWAESLDRAGQRHRPAAADLGLRLSPLRAAGGLDRRRAPPSRGTPGDRRAIAARMAEIRAAREASQPSARAPAARTFRNPPGHKAWAADRRRRLPRPAARRRAGLREALQLPDQHRHRDRRRPRGLGEEVRRRVSRRSGRHAGWEIMRIGVPAPGLEAPHDAPRRGPDGRLVRRARGVAGRAAQVRGGAAEDARPTGHAIDVERDLGRSCLARSGRSPTWCSTRCTAASARTARSRACSTAGIPYTHSGVLASALAMDKPPAKRSVRRRAGCRSPRQGRRADRTNSSAAIRCRRPSW